MKANFKDQVILITGASMGIGKELALAFAKRGAKLVLAARSLPQLETVAQACNQLGAESLVVATDVTQAEQVDALLSQTKERYGKLDVLINNAGKGHYGLLEDADAKSAQELFDLNLFSVIQLTRKSIPLLKMPSSKPRTIVNLCSVASFFSVPKMGLYCASKAALSAFSNTLRIELKKTGVRVVSVYPGVIRTGFSNHAENPDQEKVPEDYKTSTQGMSPQKLAERIVKAIACGKKREYGNFSNFLIIKSYQSFPAFFDWIMQRFV